jgi:hypothetical protein
MNLSSPISELVLSLDEELDVDPICSLLDSLELESSHALKLSP